MSKKDDGYRGRVGSFLKMVEEPGELTDLLKAALCVDWRAMGNGPVSKSWVSPMSAAFLDLSGILGVKLAMLYEIAK